MNSLKFEGTVNGQKFNSVTQYNEALKAALEAGGEVKASSRTYTENVPETEEKPTLFPGFAHCVDDLDLDSTGIANLTDLDIEKIRKDNEEFLTGLDEVLALMDAEQAKTYLQKLARIKAYLIKAKEFNREALAAVKADYKDAFDAGEKNYNAIDDAITKLDDLFCDGLALHDFADGRKACTAIMNVLESEEERQGKLRALKSDLDATEHASAVIAEMANLYNEIITKTNNHIATIDPTWMMGGVTCTDSERTGETQAPATSVRETQAPQQVNKIDQFFDDLNQLVESIFG